MSELEDAEKNLAEAYERVIIIMTQSFKALMTAGFELYDTNDPLRKIAYKRAMESHHDSKDNR